MANKSYIGFYCDPEITKKLKKISADNGVSQSAIIRISLKKYFKMNEWEWWEMNDEKKNFMNLMRETVAKSIGDTRYVIYTKTGNTYFGNTLDFVGGDSIKLSGFHKGLIQEALVKLEDVSVFGHSRPDEKDSEEKTVILDVTKSEGYEESKETIFPKVGAEEYLKWNT